jgi:threonine/homoserine/homoserine lactone efflux protein
MFGIHDVGLFVISGLLLNITPGVDFLYVLGRGAARGFGAGVCAALGIGAGCFVHIVAAALGLSAVLASSASAFTAVKWIGAAYLLYLGMAMLWQSRGVKSSLPAAAPPTSTLPATISAGGISATSASRQSTMLRIFWQGFGTNVLNPKVALFFLAFVPQFIDAHSPTKVQAFLLLGAIFNTNGTLWNIFVAWAAAFLARRLEAASGIRNWLNRCLGALFIALGMKLALAQRA